MSAAACRICLMAASLMLERHDSRPRDAKNVPPFPQHIGGYCSCLKATLICAINDPQGRHAVLERDLVGSAAESVLAVCRADQFPARGKHRAQFLSMNQLPVVDSLTILDLCTCMAEVLRGSSYLIAAEGAQKSAEMTQLRFPCKTHHSCGNRPRRVRARTMIH
jgi:hypothetical protein